MTQKLGIILLNQKMKLQLEIKFLDSVLNGSSKSFFNKIKNFFKKKKYVKLKSDLKQKHEYLDFITEYMNEHKDKMDRDIDSNLTKILSQNDFEKVKNTLNEL